MKLPITLADGSEYATLRRFSKSLGYRGTTSVRKLLASGLTPDEIVARRIEIRSKKRSAAQRPVILANGLAFATRSVFAKTCGLTLARLAELRRSGMTYDDIAEQNGVGLAQDLGQDRKS